MTDSTDIAETPTKTPRKRSGPVSDVHAAWVDPTDLTMAVREGSPFHKGPSREHPTYNPSAEKPVSLPMAVMFAAKGFLGGAIEARKEGPTLMIEDGRQRAKAATVATLLREIANQEDPAIRKSLLTAVCETYHLDRDEVKEGLKLIPSGLPLPVKVRVFLNRDDDVSAYARTFVLNRHRQTLDPFQEAQEIRHLKNLGMPDKEIAVLAGESVDTVRNRLRLLEAAPQVQEKLRKGKITTSDALRLVHLPHDQQVARLDKIPEKDPTSPKKRRTGQASKAAQEAAGKRDAPRRPSQHQITSVLDEIEDKTPASYALKWALGLVSLRVAAKPMGLSTDSPVYRHLTNKEKQPQ